MLLERLSESERGVLRCADGTFVHVEQKCGKEKVLYFPYPAVDIHRTIHEKIDLGYFFISSDANAYVAKLQPQLDLSPSGHSYHVQFYQVSRNQKLPEMKGI